MVFDAGARAVAMARREFAQHYPASGWVEHDAEDIWRDTLATAREAIERSRRRRAQTSPPSASPTSAKPRSIWERASGKPIHRAIVWQDRRTADCMRRS